MKLSSQIISLKKRKRDKALIIRGDDCSITENVIEVENLKV